MRTPAVAGMFYTGDSTRLEKEVIRYLKDAPLPDCSGEIFALVVPHAGYSYSGQIAASAYRMLEGMEFDTVVLFGPSHRVWFPGISAALYKQYRTPFGDINVDTELAQALLSVTEDYSFNESAHNNEHSLEVQLPFLQKTLKPGFSILPILFGNANTEDLIRAADFFLYRLNTGNKKLLFSCSTDLSHGHNYETAREMDGRVADMITNLDTKGLTKVFDEHLGEACGAKGLLSLLDLASRQGCRRAHVTAFKNSGDVVGDKESRIVGYLAALICK